MTPNSKQAVDVQAICSSLRKRIAERNRLEGEQDALLKQLNSEFGFALVEDAEVNLDKLADDTDELDRKIDESITKLEEYGSE